LFTLFVIYTSFVVNSFIKTNNKRQKYNDLVADLAFVKYDWLRFEPSRFTVAVQQVVQVLQPIM